MKAETAKRTKFIYGIAFSALTFVVAVLFIVFACIIYFKVGGGGGATGMYTKDDVVRYLHYLAVPFWLWVAAIIGGVVVWEICPSGKDKQISLDARYSLYRLKKKLPVEERDDLLSDMAAYDRLDKINKWIWAIVAVVCVIFAAAGLAYLLDFSHFQDENNVTAEVSRAVALVCPYVLCGLAFGIGGMYVSDYIAKKRLPYVKNLIKSGKKKDVQRGAVYSVLYDIFVEGDDRAVWTVRGVVFVLAVVFIILGSFNGGAADVLLKAVNICTECIGLG